MIRPCTNASCVNEFQDKTYGKGKRVMNICKHGTHVRCTVCNHEYALSADQAKDLKSGKEKEK